MNAGQGPADPWFEAKKSTRTSGLASPGRRDRPLDAVRYDGITLGSALGLGLGRLVRLGLGFGGGCVGFGGGCLGFGVWRRRFSFGVWRRRFVGSSAVALWPRPGSRPPRPSELPASRGGCRIGGNRGFGFDCGVGGSLCDGFVSRRFDDGLRDRGFDGGVDRSVFGEGLGGCLGTPASTTASASASASALRSRRRPLALRRPLWLRSLPQPPALRWPQPRGRPRRSASVRCFGSSELLAHLGERGRKGVVDSAFWLLDRVGHRVAPLRARPTLGSRSARCGARSGRCGPPTGPARLPVEPAAPRPA